MDALVMRFTKMTAFKKPVVGWSRIITDTRWLIVSQEPFSPPQTTGYGYMLFQLPMSMRNGPFSSEGTEWIDKRAAQLADGWAEEGYGYSGSLRGELPDPLFGNWDGLLAWAEDTRRWLAGVDMDD